MMEELANWYILTLVITELQCETESPGGLVETLIVGPHQQSFCFCRFGWGLKVCKRMQEWSNRGTQRNNWKTSSKLIELKPNHINN